MNFIFLLLTFLFLFIRSDSKPKCRTYHFLPQISQKKCRCNNINHSPMGRIFNGTDLDSRDLPYVVSIYGFKITHITDPSGWRPEFEFDLYCAGTIISSRFVLT